MFFSKGNDLEMPFERLIVQAVKTKPKVFDLVKKIRSGIVSTVYPLHVIKLQYR